MPAVGRNLTLNRRKREPENTGIRVPENDKPCPKCLRDRAEETMMFHIEGTDSTGKSFFTDWCSWHQSEMQE